MAQLEQHMGQVEVLLLAAILDMVLVDLEAQAVVVRQVLLVQSLLRSSIDERSIDFNYGAP
jgi:Trp operon repressor